VKIDVASAATEATELGTGRFPSEPVFVPRGRSDREDDGYLLSLPYDATVDRSFVAILDALEPSHGPLTRVWFDHHIPRPSHGTWHGPWGRCRTSRVGFHAGGDASQESERRLSAVMMELKSFPALGLHSYLENGGGVRAGVIVESPKLGASVTLLLSLPLATP
jgi:Retinal pigment epithelial membrane protein